MTVKTRVRDLTNRMGWDLRRAGWDGWGPEKLQQLANPRTVIDVGVWDGTPELYAAFPTAELLLIDPLPAAAQNMERILQTRSGTYRSVAVGREKGESSLHIIGDDTTASSLHTRVSGSKFAATSSVSVDVERLDDIVLGIDLPDPILLKIDAEGHELAIVQGATDVLARTACVIAEVSVAQRFEDGYRFSELVGALSDSGFELADLLTTRRDPTTRQVLRLDAAFTRPA